MAPKKIVVFGITGVQGGSVGRYLLEDGPDKFEVWGVTRSKTSAKAKGTLPSHLQCSLLALEAQGIKLIEGDLDKPESYEAGLAGADNVWVNADCKSPLTCVVAHTQSGSTTTATTPTKPARAKSRRTRA